MQNSVPVSPALMMDIIKRIEESLHAKYSPGDIKHYISKWHSYDRHSRENFCIHHGYDSIDLPETLHSMDGDLLLQIAVDLEIEVPGLIYGIPEIRGILATRYEEAGRTFEKAFKNIDADPSIAILMANSALEKIIKKICSDPSIESCDDGDTLHKLISHVLRQFEFYPDRNLDSNIRNIGSGLITTANAIEGIRSRNTEAHGTDREIVKESLYAMLVVNAVATVGLFLLNYYEKHYKKQEEKQEFSDLDDEIPF